MAYPVKVFKSTDTGAPVLSGTPGTLVALLDACFLTGYGSANVTTLAASGGVATAYVGTGHGFNDGDILLVSGAAQSAYNAEAAITVVDTTHFTYPISGSPPSPTTGTITAKYSPHTSWTKVFAGTNTAAYKSNEPAATGMLLRVDDSTATYATVQGYEAMADIDHGFRPFPTALQVAANIAGPGVLWARSNAASGAARAWILATDGRIIYFASAFAGNTLYETQVFGDIVSFRPGDAFGCVMAGLYSTSFIGNQPGNGSGFNSIGGSTHSGTYLARAHNQIGSAIQSMHFCGVFGQNGYGTAGTTYPNPADNALHLEYPTYIGDSASVLRGIRPGIYNPMANLSAAAFPPSTGDRIANVVGFPGKVFLYMKGGNGSTGAPYLIDLTGPWR